MARCLTYVRSALKSGRMAADTTVDGVARRNAERTLGFRTEQRSRLFSEKS
jgi:hypothetical protein